MSKTSTQQDPVNEASAAQAYGIVPNSGTVRFERLLPGPIERIWSYLADSEMRGKWLATGAMEPCVGGRVELYFEYPRLSNGREEAPAKYKEKEICDLVGVVLRWEPLHALACTWGEHWGGNSQVMFELTPRGEHVLLVFTHSGLPRQSEMAVAAGWHAHIDILIDHLAGRSPASFWGALMRLEAEYERRFKNAK